MRLWSSKIGWVASTCAGVVLIAVLWRFDPSEVKIPLCAFHTLTGLSCPGCGATRATHELLHGRLVEAFRDNALFVCSLPLMLYVAVSEYRFRTGGSPLPGNLSQSIPFWVGFGLIALAFSVGRNLF